MRAIVLGCGLLIICMTSGSKATAAEANGGRQFFIQYCSSCHGKDARGNGSVAPYLKIKVPDLTLLRRRNKGIFPLDDVLATIDGRRLVHAHGERDMPVWGEVFAKELEPQKYSELIALVKANTIAEYLATLQR